MILAATNGIVGRHVRRTCDPNSSEFIYVVIGLEYTAEDISGDYKKTYCIAPDTLICLPAYRDNRKQIVTRFNIDKVTFTS